MKALYEYINEGILAGQENTIDDGDKLLKTINKEWEQIKALENKKNWRKGQVMAPVRGYNNRYMFQPGYTQTNLLQYIGLDNRLGFQLWATEDDTNMEWRCEFVFPGLGSSEKTITFTVIFKYGGRKKGFERFLKLYIAPIFESIETFKQFVDEHQKDMRQY